MSEVDPAPPAAYFELSWAILSTIGITNIFFSIIVIGIAGFTPISLVPIIVSVAGATANGLCYYAFYAHYPEVNTAVASAVADVAWLVSRASSPSGAVVDGPPPAPDTGTSRSKKPACPSTAM